MMNNAGLDAIVDELLLPVGGDAPGGRWLRYERVYMELAKSREEDDPNLPLGEWERPLVKANWKQVAGDCVKLLRDDSKDFQIAAWLCDAWVRLHQMDGLRASLALVTGLAQRHWDHAWPAIEDGDADRRVAPFVWLNTSLPLTLKLNVSLLAAGPLRAEPLKMFDWERASTRDDARPDAKADAKADAPPPSRQAIRASVKPADGPWLQAVAQQAADASATLRALVDRLDERLGQESPSLARLQAMVDAIAMACAALLQEIPPPVVEAPAAPAAAAAPAPADTPAPVQPAAAVAAPVSAAPASGFVSREHAYQVLDAAARYLAEIEPHSPTPYLIRRAAQLGQMSLPQMLAEVTADAGSLDKFFSLLGVRQAR